MASKDIRKKLLGLSGLAAFYFAFISPEGARFLQEEKRDIEFVHITHTGGLAVEQVGAQADIKWGSCHYIKSLMCDDKAPDLTYDTKNKENNIWHSVPTEMNELKGVESPYLEKDLFTIVRNPYERLINEFYCPWFGTKGDRNDPAVLNDFIMYRLSKIDRENNYYPQKHLIPQHKYVYDSEGNRVIKNIVHFENIVSEFNDVMSEYGQDAKMTSETDLRENRDGNLTRINLTPETIKAINELYAGDFAAFGYEMVETFQSEQAYEVKSSAMPCKTFLPDSTECERDEMKEEPKSLPERVYDAPIGVAHSTSFLLGIFSSPDENGAIYRQLARDTYLNVEDRRICTFDEYKRQQENMMVPDCRIPYVFVVGGNPDLEEPNEEVMEVERNLLEGPIAEETDVLFLNVQDSNLFPKSKAFFKWATEVGVNLNIDFVAKVGADTLLDMPLLIDFIDLDLPSAPYNRRMYGGGIWGYWWEGGYYATNPFYFMSLDLSAFVSTRDLDWATENEDHDMGRMVFKHPKPVKFINLNTRTFWHEKMETPEMWNDAWKNRMGELPIRKPAVENTKICQSFKDQGLMKD